MAGHRHDLSVNLTPSIVWDGKHLKDVVTIPSFFSVEPFKRIKNKVELLTPILVLSPTQHSASISPNLNVISNWRVSFSCTKDNIWGLLDDISTNIRRVFRYMKVVRNLLYPYYVKYQPNCKKTEGVWQGGQLVSSWTLFNMLLQKVKQNPKSGDWDDGQFRERLLETLESMLDESYEDFFYERREICIKFPTLVKQVKLDVRISINLTGIINNMRCRPNTCQQRDSAAVDKVVQSCKRLEGKVSAWVEDSFIVINEDKLRFDTKSLCKDFNIVREDKIFFFKMPVIDAKHDNELLEDTIYIDLLHELMSYFQDRK